MYDRKTIEEMNSLSKLVFGTTSKWRKMVEIGVPELVEEETKKLKLKDGKEFYETVKTPKMYISKNGKELNQSILKRYTVNEAKEFMFMVLNRRTQMQQAIKK